MLRGLLGFACKYKILFPGFVGIILSNRCDDRMPQTMTNSTPPAPHLPFLPRRPPFLSPPTPRRLWRCCRRRLGKIAPGGCMCHCLLACFLTPGDVSIGFTCRVKVESPSAPYGSTTAAATVTPGRPGIAGSGADVPPPRPPPMLSLS